MNPETRGEAVRRFIVEHVDEHPADIARLAGEKFQISRQAVNRHLQLLVQDGTLQAQGQTRSRTYRLTPLAGLRWAYPIGPALVEDRPWMRDVRPTLLDLPDNVIQIWHYGFTEMLNNAIEHSEGSWVTVTLEKTAAATTIAIHDDGVGIFRKIQAALDLLDERHAPLELAKGKFTTDPAHHSGEGVFFASRMFDDFVIASGAVYFSHVFGDRSNWILERETPSPGTTVLMKLANHSTRTTKQVFDAFSTGEDYGFTRTVVPIDLVRYGDDNLVSRSQARRLLTRFERFRTVVLDFTGIDQIGQAFADEVFRVFPTMHPDVELVEIHTNSAVRQMISRARTHS